MSTHSYSKRHGGTSGKHTVNRLNDESAARTRPFSFEDIMLRRKNKKSDADAEEGGRDAKNHLGREGMDKNITNHYESEGTCQHSEGFSHDMQNLSMEESAKSTSRRKKEDPLLKDGVTVRRSDKYTRDSGVTAIAKLKYGINGEGKEQRNDHKDSGGGENCLRSRNSIVIETRKRHSRDTVGKDRHEDHGRGKFDRESKRKHRNGDNAKHKDRNDAKKYDHSRHRDLEHRERKENKLPSSSLKDESKLKIRRKRSQDRENKRGRSISLSPRARKYSKIERQKELPLDSLAKKSGSGRWRSDSDRIVDSTNGLNSQYRRHSGSTSGLGGYSPRKRRTESAIKTPPPVQSPEKKSAGWDLLPVVKDGLSSGSIPSTFQPANNTVSSAVNVLFHSVSLSPAAGKSMLGVSSHNIATKTNTSLDLIQLTQATRPMRRLYIENLPPSASERAVIQWLNSFLTSSRVNLIEGTLPCISCIIHRDKGQALVEFLTPEDASAALSFDGSDFFGSTLKIRRPKDFVEIVTGDLNKSVAAVNTISDIVEDSPNKIFIGGISNAISPKMLRDIVAAFGPLKAYCFWISKDLNEPCAFLEYVDQSVTLKACAGLNGMKIGGRLLKVFPAFPLASASELNERQPCYGIPEHVKPLLQQPTVVLKLKNVFDAETMLLLSESEIDEILDDTRFECARFGTIKSMNVVKWSYSCVDAKEKFKNINVVMKHEFHELRTSESLGAVNNLDEGNCTDDSRLPNKVTQDRPCQVSDGDAMGFEALDCKNTSDEIHQELSGQLSSPGNKFEFHDTEVAEIIDTDENGLGIKTVPLAGSTAVETDSEKQEILKGLDAMMGTDSNQSVKIIEKSHDDSLESVFGIGSVFIEYGRTEVACMAAQSLHGRLYDGREISIEYVDLDLYLKGFPK